MIINRPNAKQVLLNGELLASTESLAIKLSNNFDFSRRIVQEFSLVLAGQSMKFFDIGIKDRAFSHFGVYGTHGYGKGFTLKLIQNSGIFPLNLVKVRTLDNVTEAALIGTISENQIVVPPTVSEDVLIVPEFQTIRSGAYADSIGAIIRAMQEENRYTRRMAKISALKEVITTDPIKGQHVLEAIERHKKEGMTVDLDRSEIRVETTASWIVASAKFSSQNVRGRSLLYFGDIDRYRWRSYLPDRDERFKVTSEVGSLPPVQVNHSTLLDCCDAWRILITTLRKISANGSIKVPRDQQSFYSRKKVWEETQKEMLDTYSDTLNDQYQEQLFNLRSRAEFNRLMYQHAALKQFERDQGYDLAEPGKFVIDYKEDGDFARKLWIEDYAPSMMDVINDILRTSSRNRSRRNISKMQKGSQLILDLLSEGKKARKDILSITRKAEISDSLVDNIIIPKLLEKDLVARDEYGQYSLKN